MYFFFDCYEYSRISYFVRNILSEYLIFFGLQQFIMSLVLVFFVFICLKFTKLIRSVDWCFSVYLAYFWPIFVNIFLSAVFTLSFWGFSQSVQSLSRVLTLCDPKDCGIPGFPVHQLLELAQTHDHQVSDAIQPFHPLSSPSPPTFNLSQQESLFKWVNSLHQVAKVSEFQLQHQSLQWSPRTDLL